jgi:hypothetical protein
MRRASITLEGNNSSLHIALRIIGAVVWAVIVPSNIRVVTAGPTDPAVVQSMIDKAQKSVFRIKITKGASQVGSAFLVRLEPSAKKVGCQVGTFLTAYHVLHKARNFEITTFDNLRVAVAREAETLCFVDRSRELGMVKLELDPADGVKLAEFSVKEWAPLPAPNGKAIVRNTGFAFGCPAERTLQLHWSRVEFLGSNTAGALNLVRPDIEFEGDSDPAWMRFQLLGDQETFPGMSGGPVIDDVKGFAGVVYGRRMGLNVIIPAEQALDFCDRAPPAERWKRLADRPFEGDVLFKGEPGEDELETRQLDWSTFDGIGALLGGDPAGAIAQFQEVVIDPPRIDAEAKSLVVLVGPETIKNRKHRLEVWIDGRPIEWEKRGRFEIPLKDSPGESLLVIAKTSGRVNDYELGGLLVPSRVDLMFKQGRRPFLHLERSLPSIVQRYPLYITIRNARDSSRNLAPAEQPANVRIALRLDYLEGLLNQAPFEHPVIERDPQDKTKVAKTEVDGVYRSAASGAWRLREVSPQQIGVTLAGNVELRKARYEGYDLMFMPAADEQSPASFAVQGRVQFPFVMPKEPTPPGGSRIYLSARATATSGTGSFRIDLGKRTSAEMIGVLRHLFTGYINNQLTPMDRPNLIDADRIRKSLAALGLDPPPTWSLDVRRALVARSGSADWLILMIRLDSRDASLGGGAAARASSPLDKAPDSPTGVVLDITARGVPGGFVRSFPSLARANPLAAQALDATRLRDLRVTLALAGESPAWFEGLSPVTRALPVLSDGGQAIIKRVRDAFAHSAVNGKVELTASMTPDYLPAVLARALGRPKLKLVGDDGTSLSLAASSNKSGAGALLSLKGPFKIRTPRGTVVDLGDGASARDVELNVTSLAATARDGTDAVKADVAAEIKIGELKTLSATAQDAQGSIRLKLDTTPGRTELGTAVLTAGAKGRLGPLSVDVTIRDLFLTIGRDLVVRFDQKRIP